MHAGFPCFTHNLQHVLKLGSNEANSSKMLEAAGGTLLATGMAVLLKLGFGFVMRDSVLNEKQAVQAKEFFKNNFELIEPESNKVDHYQGKFLIRTSKADDQMNVYLQFCPDPENLYVDTPLGRCFNSLAVIKTDVLSEEEADKLETDPNQVDLVIRFRDINSILNLIGKEDIDIVGLLLENVVQLRGNVGHLFKLGNIATDIELLLENA